MAEARPGSRLAELEARWRQEPKSTAFFPYAEELRRSGNLERAIEILEQGLALHPNYLAARVALGRDLLEAGEVVASVEVLERALASDPTQLVASKLLIEAHRRLGNLESARQHLAKYRLLVGKDPEIEAIESRLVEAEGAAGEIGQDSGRVWEAEPLSEAKARATHDDSRALDLVFEAEAVFQLSEASTATRRPFAFDPQPSRKLRAVSPFGELGIPVTWAERWRSFGEEEGLFPVASGLPLSRQLAVPVSTLPATAEPAKEVAAVPIAPRLEVLEEPALSEADRTMPEPAGTEPELAALSLSTEREAEELFAVPDAGNQPTQPASGWFRPEEIRFAVEQELAVEAFGEGATQLAAAAETTPEPPGLAVETAWRDSWSESPAVAEMEALASAPVPAAEEASLTAEPAFLESGATAPELQAATEEERSSWVLGKLFLEQGHLEDAEREFVRVLAERPDHPEALAGLREVAVRRQGTLGAPTLSSTERRLQALRGYLNRIQRFKEAWRVP